MQVAHCALHPPNPGAHCCVRYRKTPPLTHFGIVSPCKGSINHRAMSTSSYVYLNHEDLACGAMYAHPCIEQPRTQVWFGAQRYPPQLAVGFPLISELQLP